MNLLLKIFKTPSLPNSKGWGPDILTQCSLTAVSYDRSTVSNSKIFSSIGRTGTQMKASQDKFLSNLVFEESFSLSILLLLLF